MTDFAVNFLATALGVGLTFFVDFLIRRWREKRQYRQLLWSVLEESKVNAGRLARIAQYARPGGAVLVEPQLAALTAALANPAIYWRAPVSLVVPMRVAEERLGILTNLIAMHRSDTAMTVPVVEEMKLRAETGHRVIHDVLQRELAFRIAALGGKLAEDPRFAAVGEKLKAIDADEEVRIASMLRRLAEWRERHGQRRGPSAGEPD